MGKKILLLGLSLIFVFVFAACSSKSPSSVSGAAETSPGEPVKLTFWNTNYKTLDENDKSKKKEEFYIYQAAKRFHDKYPMITVDIVDVPGGPEGIAKFKTSSIAKNGPDIGTIWAGSYIASMKQFIEPLDDYLNGDPILDNLSGWDAVNVFADGKILGVPAGNDGQLVLFYNKELLAKAGLDYDKNPPADAAAWMADLEKLKQAKIDRPLAWDPYNFWFQGAYWVIQSIGMDGLKKLGTGQMSFQDPLFKNIVNTYDDFNKKQYVTTDTPTQFFNQGKAAMTIGGAWLLPDALKVLGDSKLGMTHIPNFNGDVKVKDSGVGGVGSGFFITNYSKHKKEAIEFLKFLSTKDEQTALLKAGEVSIVPYKDIDVSQYNKSPLYETMQQWSTSSSQMPYLDNSLNAEVADVVTKLIPAVVTGQTGVDDFLKQVDEKNHAVGK